MLKYTEHRPDAERGREISSGVLTLLDLVDKADYTDSTPEVLRSDRTRIYTPRLLLDYTGLFNAIQRHHHEFDRHGGLFRYDAWVVDETVGLGTAPKDRRHGGRQGQG
jgi:hypothetical protein